MGAIKGVERIYQQTFVDMYSKWAAAKLYTTKTPITGADLLNDRVLPFFASQEMGILRILTDRGTEYRGKLETHDYQLYLGINDIEHTRTRTRHPQTNGIKHFLMERSFGKKRSDNSTNLTQPAPSGRSRMSDQV